jgi:hypothetical protein
MSSLVANGVSSETGDPSPIGDRHARATIEDPSMQPRALPPDDPRLLDVGCDVVVRFKGSGSYKGEAGAIKAMRRRAPGFSDDEYRAVFEMFCQVHDLAVEAIQRHPAERPEKKRRVCEFEDIDYAACMGELETIEPGVAVREKGSMLNWVILVYYLM